MRREQPGNRGNIRDHPADERIHHVQRGDIQQHASRARLLDRHRQVVLQRHGELVMHVHLDRDQQELADTQDRDAFDHVAEALADTVYPERFSASVSASASVAFVEMPCRSMPRWTMVWAICGRMPLMMQSAPISRMAVTVLSRCWATSVSTVGTPVISMIAISEPVSTMRCSSDSMTIWVRALSSVPIIGNARTPSHNFTTGVDNSSISSCWRRMMSSLVFWNALTVKRPSRSTSSLAAHVSADSRAVSLGMAWLRRWKRGFFSENT